MSIFSLTLVISEIRHEFQGFQDFPSSADLDLIFTEISETQFPSVFRWSRAENSYLPQNFIKSSPEDSDIYGSVINLF